MDPNMVPTNQQPEQQDNQQNNITPPNVPPAPESNIFQPIPPEIAAKKSPNNRKKGNNKNIWIVLGSVLGGLVLIAVIVASIIPLLNTSGDNLFVGNWGCTRYMYSSNDFRSSPTTMMQLKNDGTFVYGQYGDLENNHFAGTYTATPSNKTDVASGYRYYNLTFGSTTEFVQNGNAQSTEGRRMDNMEIGIIEYKDSKEATLISESSYTTYYCKSE